MIFEGFASKEKIKQNLGNHKKSSFCLKKPRKLAKILDVHGFFKQNDDFLMIFWWFFKPRKSSKNHQKISFCVKKPRKLAKIVDFHCFSKQNDDFWWFFDDFLGFVWFSLLKQNHRKIIKKSLFWLVKNKKTCQNLGFSLFFKQNDDFFDDFLMIS